MNNYDIILKREEELQKPEVRKSVERLEDIISDDLIEIGSSGEMYTKKDVLVNLPNAPTLKFVMTEFKITEITPNIVQTFFKTEKTVVETGATSYSMRSTMWKNENGTWRMIFHQGTPVKN